MMKIDIKIENSKNYQRIAEVAFLVDRDDFLADITKIRRLLRIKHFPYAFPKYLYDEANRIADLHKTGQISIDGARVLLEDFCSKAGLPNLFALDKTLARVELFARSLAERYKKNYMYVPVIVGAILNNKVREEDFRSTQVLEINHETLKGLFMELGLKEKGEEIMTIRVNRESTREEVDEVFDHIQKYYFKTKPTSQEDNLAHVYNDLPLKKLPDWADNIRRDRDWYWLKKSGWSYKEIRKSYKSQISWEGVKRAIDRYADNLNTPL